MITNFACSARTGVVSNMLRELRFRERYGYLSGDLVRHIESLMTFGMTWENYGKVWEIDHIKPLSAFDLTDPVEWKKASRIENLRPLFKPDNQRKGAKWLPCQELRQD